MQPSDPSQLLADSRWMRSLAGSLIYGDASVLDDLVQETWLVALERRIPPTRAWTRTVMRNLVRMRFRSQARRRDREVFAHEERDVPSPSELTTRMDLQRRLAEAVLRLREPFRETVLLRFNEDMQPQEIAAHLGIAPGTARSRLKRGLDLLREDLDQDHGSDGKTWALALLPLAGSDLGAPTPSLAAGAWPLLAGLMVGLLGLVAVQFSTTGSTGPSEFTGEPLAQGVDEPAKLRGVAEAGPDGAWGSGRSLIPDQESGPRGTPALELSPGTRTIRGVAHGPRGLPLSDVGLQFVEDRWSEGPAHAVGRTAADGSFAVDVPPTTGALQVEDANWCSLFDSTIWSEVEDREAVLVGARPVDVSLQVLDDRGEGVAGARVRFALPEHFRRDFPRRLATANRFHGVRATDAAGRLHWERVPWLEGASLHVGAEGFVPARIELHPAGLRNWVVTLERSALGTRDLAGTVRGPLGEEHPGAWVCIGRRTVRSVEDGTFRFRNLAAPIGTQIHWCAPGRAPRTLRLTEEHFTAGLHLSLGEPTKTLGGRVVDARGEPLAGARVWIADPTYLGRDGESGAPLYAESLALAGEPFPWEEARTDRDGRFLLSGLSDRNYELIVLGPGGVNEQRTGPWAAGRTEVNVTLPERSAGPLLGQVLDPAGQPVAGLTLWLERTVLVFPYDPESLVEHPNRDESVRVQYPVEGRVVVMEDQASTLRRVVGEPVTTDSQGRFRLGRRGSRGKWYLRAWKEGWLHREWLLDNGNPRGTWTVAPERLFRVERNGTGLEHDSYRAITAEGEPCELVRSDGDILIFLERGSFRGERSATYGVSARARSLVFEKDGREVGRLPLHLEAGRTVTVGL